MGTVDTLLAALVRGRDKRGVRLSTWNVRWLLSPHTERALAKKAAIGKVLRSGSVVLLQETHWTECAAAQWGGLFAAAQVAHAPSRLGPRGGPQGGVAVIAPHPHRILSSRILVPGCAIEAVLALDGGERRAAFVLLYLPPGGALTLRTFTWAGTLTCSLLTLVTRRRRRMLSASNSSLRPGVLAPLGWDAPPAAARMPSPPWT